MISHIFHILIVFLKTPSPFSLKKTISALMHGGAKDGIAAVIGFGYEDMSAALVVHVPGPKSGLL